MESYASLAKPVHFPLSGKTAPNRLYRSAQSEYASTFDENNRPECGKPLKEYETRYKDIANGGAGLICTGNIPIHRDYLENEGNAVLDPNNTWDAVSAFKPAVKAAKSNGAIFLAQLQYPGRQCPDFINKHPKSASDVQLRPCLEKEYCKPVPLEISDIEDLKKRYAWAASKLALAGADGVILHGCHGYILSQFLSPLTNRRQDKYGGSLENRARFILEVVDAIKTVMPTNKFVIGVKFNCQDFIKGGTTFAQACIVMKWLEDAGVDFFDISGGTYESPAWRGNIMKGLINRPSRVQWGSYFLEWAEQMKGVLTRAVIGTTGGWRDASLMNKAVEESRIDMCGMARPLRLQPNFIVDILAGRAREAHL